MKKFSKVFLIALCALTTTFSVVACNGATGESSSEVASSSEGVSSSLDTTSSEEQSSVGGSGETSDSTSEGGNQGGAEGGEEGGNQGGSEGGEEGGNQGGSEGGEEGGNEDIVEVFGVTFNAAEGLTVNGETEATEGQPYSFYISVNTGYQKTDAYAVSATMGGEPVTLTDEDGDYTIANVTGDIVITVSGVEKKTFNVTKPDTVGVEFTGAETVVFGETYTFSVAFADGYTAGEDFAVSVNGEVIEGVDGTYTVENVKSVLFITIEGVEEVQYVATFTANYADALKNEKEGFKHEAENYTFKIELNDKYTQCAEAISVFYKVEGSEEEIAVTPDAEGVYTIVNPKANVEIIVKDVALNQYEVTFQRNAVVKYETIGFAGEALTQEQIDAAIAAVVGENEEFVAWREDITATIEDDTVFSAVTRVKEAWGELIEGNPLKNGAEQTDVYSAAGYEKVYTKAGFEKAPFAEIDLSAYQTVKFAFKHEKSWILFEGWTYYLDCRATWIDVTMERAVTGDWNVTMEVSVNHNSDGGLTVLNPYTTTLTGNTLNEIFALWENESNATDLYATELRGEKIQLYGEEIVNQAIEGSTQTTEVSPAIGFSSVYKYESIPAETAFADVAISGYSEVKFNMWLDNGYVCIIGWGAFAENAQWDKQWVPITLTNNGSGWTVSIEAHLSSSNGVLEAYPYTYTASGTKLSEVLATWFDFASDSATIYITEIRGIKAPPAPAYGTEIVAQALKNATAVASEPAPQGFEKVYSQSGFAQGDFADVNISGYETVRFQMKANSWILFDGWSKYIDKRNTWLPVEMVNNGSGDWTVTVDGQTITCVNGTTLNTVLSKWYTDAGDFTIYTTEIRGVEKEVTEPSEPTIWGTIVDNSVLTSEFVTLDETATAPDGFENVYLTKGFTIINKSTVDISEYSEIRFAVKSTKYFLINGWSVYFKESYTDWANVVMVNNNDGTWTVTIYGDVFATADSSVSNPYVITYTGNTLNELLAAWETSDATTYVTEVRGVKA